MLLLWGCIMPNPSKQKKLFQVQKTQLNFDVQPESINLAVFVLACFESPSRLRRMCIRDRLLVRYADAHNTLR